MMCLKSGLYEDTMRWKISCKLETKALPSLISLFVNSYICKPRSWELETGKNLFSPLPSQVGSQVTTRLTEVYFNFVSWMPMRTTWHYSVTPGSWLLDIHSYPVECNVGWVSEFRMIKVMGGKLKWCDIFSRYGIILWLLAVGYIFLAGGI